MSDYISHISLELQLLILKTLPIKTLLQCRCLSKSWKQLIASKSLILDHLAIQTPQILVQNQNYNYLLFDPQTLPLSSDSLKSPIPLPPTHHGSTITTIHGVICVYNGTLLLFNPSIRRFSSIHLPDLPIFQSNDHSFNHCGFWIDPPSNDYKVVVFCLELKDSVIFLSKTQSWIEVSMGDIRDFELDNRSPQSQLLIQGVAHWIAFDKDGLGTTGYLVSFDFKQHEFATVDLPPNDRPHTPVFLCKWRDLLSVVHCEFDDVCYLWTMQNGSWSKMFSFEYRPNVSDFSAVMESSGWVLGSDDKCRVLLHDHRVGLIYLHCEFEFPGLSFLSHGFVESLVFPVGNGVSTY